MSLRVAIAIICLLLPTCLYAQQTERVALVVGNSSYLHTAKLATTRNDAADLAEALRAAGFRVMEAADLNKVEFKRKIGEFSGAVAGADLGVFFYAGHGLQVKGKNFLVPIDAQLATDAAVYAETVSLDHIMQSMEPGRSRLIILDASRANPLAGNLTAIMPRFDVG